MRALLRNERGMEMVQYVAMSGVVVSLIMAIWLVFYGGAGDTLRSAVQTQIEAYAAGFEGGLSTSGPTGRVPDLSSVPVRFDPTPFRPIAIGEQAFKSGAFAPRAKDVIDFDPTAQQAVPFDPTALQAVPFVAIDTAKVVVQPMPNVKVTLDPQRGTVTLFEPVQQRTYVLDTVRGTASVFNPVTQVRQPVSLVEMQRLGVVAVRTVSQVAQVVQSIKVVVLSIPTLLR